LDLTDEAIRLSKKDLIETKQQMYSKYRLGIKRIGKTEYKWFRAKKGRRIERRCNFDSILLHIITAQAF
jgi:hypothetical protein